MRAFGKYILVKPFKRPTRNADGKKYTAEEMEAQGIYFPGTGKVLSFGDLVVGIKKGEVIRFKKHNEEVVDDGVGEQWLVPVDTLLGIEEKQ